MTLVLPCGTVLNCGTDWTYELCLCNDELNVLVNFTCNVSLYNILVLVDTMFELYMRIHVRIRFEFFGEKMYCRGGSI